MFRKASFGRKVFIVFNYTFCIILALLCILPLIHIFALSFSSDVAINAGKVTFLPVDFTTASYEYVAKNNAFMRAFCISIVRVVLGVSIGMTMTILAGYPLSKTQRQFSLRPVYTFYFMVAMVFSGGMIPTYLVVSKAGLIDTIWALVLPNAVNVFNVVLMQNYIKSLPDEIMESAFVDGAGHWTNLFKIVLPLSKPVLASLVLFTGVANWNAWFDGTIYMNKTANYPLQSYLRTVVVDVDLSLISNIDQALLEVTQKGSKSAQIFLAMVPILCVYPFLQKHFAGGIVMGSVKG